MKFINEYIAAIKPTVKLEAPKSCEKSGRIGIINPKPRTQPFFEFYQSFWKNMINVRNRQISTDGKTGGYPTLQYLWYSYLTMYQDTGIQNDNFSYQKMIEYISGIGGYWLNLVDQFVPATTCFWIPLIATKNINYQHKQCLAHQLLHH